MSDEHTSKFASLLFTKRKSLGLSQRELARRVGIKASHVAYLENARRRPSLSLLKRIADELGANPTELLLLSHPETKALLSPSAGAKRRKPRRESWRNFANQGLVRRNEISIAELKLLRQIYISLNVSNPHALLLILAAIRMAVDICQEQTSALS